MLCAWGDQIKEYRILFRNPKPKTILGKPVIVSEILNFAFSLMCVISVVCVTK